MEKALMVKEVDNVAVALAKIDAGQIVSLTLPSGRMVKEIMARQEIPFAHKIAVSSIEEGNRVIRYGEAIGLAKEEIGEGFHVHVHNVKSGRFA